MGKQSSVLTLESSEESSIIKEPSENEENTSEISNVTGVTSMSADVPENRPNLLAASPQFGNIIALTEVTKPEDRYMPFYLQN